MICGYKSTYLFPIETFRLVICRYIRVNLFDYKHDNVSPVSHVSPSCLHCLVCTPFSIGSHLNYHDLDISVNYHGLVLNKNDKFVS